jgi:chromate transporter
MGEGDYLDNSITENENRSPDNIGASLLEILFTFLKIGTFTFGGGYAILPIIQREIVYRLEWVDEGAFMDILIITQSLPGPLALNCSIIVGRRLRGTLGGLTAALGIVLPSFLIILLLAAFLLPVVWNNEFVQAIFYGLRPAVVALVAAAACDLGRKFVKDRLSLSILVLLLAVSLVFHLQPVLILALGALLGLFFFRKSKQ